MRESLRVPKFSIDVLESMRVTIERITVEYVQREVGFEQRVKIFVVKIEITLSSYYAIWHLIFISVFRITLKENT